MVKMTGGWPMNSPDKLEDICVNFCIQNIETLAYKDVDKEEFILHPSIILPKSLCDKLVKTLISTKDEGYLDKLPIFSNRERTQISTLCLRDSKINDDQLKTLVNQPIVELELTNCHSLTHNSFHTINHLKHTLKSLKIEGCTILQSDELYESDSNTNAQVETVLECTNLRTLSIHDVDCRNILEFDFKHVLSQMTQLTCLDLSDCILSYDNVRQLKNLSHLVSLILNNVIRTENKYFVDFITKIKTLRHLDISVSNDIIVPLKYNEPTRTLTTLVTNLPNLISLDISGTNLADGEKIKPVSHRLEPTSAKLRYELEEVESGIPGLKGRQLEFLGLVNCAHDPCFRDNIPANKITGNANEEQVLLAVEVYQDRSLMLYTAFNMLFHRFQGGEIVNQCRALEGLLNGMQRHPHDKHVQITGSASLFYIAKGEQKDNLTQQQKRRFIDLVLDGMENFSNERTMMRNGCLTLCYFNVSQEVVYYCARLSTVLLNMLKSDIQDDFMHRIGIYLINCLACQVKHKQKALIGELGAIETMLKIIKKKIEEKECDDMMEVAWSSMWNITDETAQNCRKFIDCGGMDLFLQCLELFKDRAELLRNMMGLMGNIAEVKELRPLLMVSKYISVFSDLLESTSDGIEVSYNAAGVLAHIASDGVEAWTITETQRDLVLCRLTAAINRWDITSKRNINYRSFEPLLRLLDKFDTPPVQHWTIWALCNLTNVYPEKYCELLENEHGPERLKSLLEDKRSETYLKDLINQILTNIKEFKVKPSGASAKDCDDCPEQMDQQ